MTESNRRALLRLTGGNSSRGISTGELESLLLQIVFALLMVFMIAYFIFVESAKKKQEEQLMELNHQKLILAIEKTSENHRVKYGLNALMTQGTDGNRTFDATEHVKGGKLDIAPAAKAAFATGSAAAWEDYRDIENLKSVWIENVFATAELTEDEIGEEEMKWLKNEVAIAVENMRLDTRGVQRALAARLQESLIEHPEVLGDIRDAAALAAAIKAKSLEEVKSVLGTEVLP